MKKKIFSSAILAVALTGAAFGTGYSAHASTLQPHQSDSTFISIDHTVHLNWDDEYGGTLLVGVHYRCFGGSLAPTLVRGAIFVTATQNPADSGDADTVTGTGAEFLNCDGNSHEVSVPVINPAEQGEGFDFNDGPVAVTAGLFVPPNDSLPSSLSGATITSSIVANADEH